MKPTKTWKSLELRVAKFFGTKRNPLSGINSGHTASDTLHSELFIECKHRKQMSLYSLFKKTLTLAKKEDKIPILAMHQTGEKGFLLVVHCEDFDKVCDIMDKKK